MPERLPILSSASAGNFCSAGLLFPLLAVCADKQPSEWVESDTNIPHHTPPHSLVPHIRLGKMTETKRSSPLGSSTLAPQRSFQMTALPVRVPIHTPGAVPWWHTEIYNGGSPIIMVMIIDTFSRAVGGVGAKPRPDLSPDRVTSTSTITAATLGLGES